MSLHIRQLLGAVPLYQQQVAGKMHSVRELRLSFTRSDTVHTNVQIFKVDVPTRNCARHLAQ